MLHNVYELSCNEFSWYILSPLREVLYSNGPERAVVQHTSGSQERDKRWQNSRSSWELNNFWRRTLAVPWR